MDRVMTGIMAFLLAWPALAADDQPKDKPAAQYQALVKEYEDAQQAFFKAYQEAPSEEAKQQLRKEKSPFEKFAPKFLELAEKYPKDHAALDALVWIVTNAFGPISGKDDSRTKALAILVRDHMQSPELGRACQNLSFMMDAAVERFLRTVLEKSAHPEVQAEACLALAQGLHARARMARELKKNPDLGKQIQEDLGGDVASILKEDLAKLDRDSEQLFRQFTANYLSRVKPERLKSVSSRLGYAADKGSEGVLRALLDKHVERDVQGAACLSLAQLLKRRADESADSDAQGAAKLRQESEALCERALEKFADVQLEFYGPVGKKAKSELYELRHLVVGKVAPDIDGEDQDGTRFKLSDYRGKVVLLDFWSQH
jgi:hypothetical protein